MPRRSRRPGHEPAERGGAGSDLGNVSLQGAKLISENDERVLVALPSGDFKVVRGFDCSP